MPPDKFKDRVRELRRVRAGELRPNPKNWRLHPQAQSEALKAVLADIGFAGAVLARELPDGRLELIDGHLRRDVAPEQEIPVLVLDVTEEEATKMLLTFDPLSAMAEADKDRLGALLDEVSVEDGPLRGMLDGLRAQYGLDGETGPVPPLSDCESVDMPYHMRQATGANRGVVSLGRLSAFAPLDNLSALANLIVSAWGNDWGEDFVRWAIAELEGRKL